MKIKIEMDLSRWLSRAILIGVPIVVVAIGAWVYADVPNTFKAGDTVSSQKLNDNFAAVATPPGTVVAFAGTNVPSGWLLCDGSAVSRLSYAALFSAIAVTYGIGDAVNTFNLPDLRAAGIRGVGTSTQFAANATVALGKAVDDQMQGHRHAFATGDNSAQFPPPSMTLTWSPGSWTSTSGNFGNNAAMENSNPESVAIGNPYTDLANGTPRTGAETTGKAIGLNYIIKY
jgi:microcystin-dependent protein